MIAVDTNVLVAAHKSGAVAHSRAVTELSGLVSSAVPWAIPMPCVHEFYATVTHPRKYTPPSTAQQAFDQLYAWIDGGAVVISEAVDHLERLRNLVTAGRVVGGMVHDAKIATICLSHGISELWTADRDFSRFPALRTRNPLVT
ncbi:MAG: VapC toxin family PIN domain ribonuclease [Actinobacteria bacterium 69-20]|jgi:toxin-antitoxin system PIN domain toxin|nr:PIN domain-containing protein [Actinomycetota bacterium]OJV24635.1 MAG: VapC toxin family PIN domain ribonuclease [Actinobacteria bacterium 69-20]